VTDYDYDDRPEADDGYSIPRRHWSQQVHKTSQYQALRRQHRRYCALERNDDGSYGLPCWRCNQPINYQLAWPHPQSYSLDHHIPVRQSPELALALANFRPSHLRCNLSEYQDDGADEIDIGEPSETW